MTRIRRGCLVTPRSGGPTLREPGKIAETASPWGKSVSAYTTEPSIIHRRPEGRAKMIRAKGIAGLADPA